MHYLSFLAGLPHYNTLTIGVKKEGDVLMVQVENRFGNTGTSTHLYSNLVADLSMWVKANMSTVFAGYRDSWNKKQYNLKPKSYDINYWYNPYNFEHGSDKEI